MEEEGGDVFDVRSIILGHIQRGGAPTPFDRVLAARLAAEAVNLLSEPSSDRTPFYTIGLQGNEIASRPLEEAMNELDWPWERPKDQWFMPFLSLVREM